VDSLEFSRCERFAERIIQDSKSDSIWDFSSKGRSMSSTSDRPKKGLSLPQAFAKYSEPAKYQVLVEIAGTSDLPSIAHSGLVAQRERGQEYKRLREELERAFVEMMLKGETVFASGIPKHGNGRRAIEPALWEIMEVDFDLEDLAANGHIFEKPEFFERSVIPSNVLYPPEWLAPRPSAALQAADEGPVFRPEQNFEYVHIKHTFKLGTIRAKVVRLLHEASLTDNPWRPGKMLLRDAGSSQTKLHDVFKDLEGWQLLIMSDNSGKYRLHPKWTS
jgi:hypothetical protein